MGFIGWLLGEESETAKLRKEVAQLREDFRRANLSEGEREQEDIKNYFSKLPSREEMKRNGMLVRDGRGGWKMRAPY